MTPDHLLVTIICSAAIYYFIRVMRSPRARAEMKARQRRRDFRRSLVNRSDVR